MKFHRVIFFIWGILFSIEGNSQFNAHWVFPYGFHLDFSQGSLQIDSAFNTLGINEKIYNDYYNYTFSDRKGNLLFYAHTIDTLYNARNTIICTTNSIQGRADFNNERTFIVPAKNDTDFSFLTADKIEVNNHTEVIAYIKQYTYKWITNKYVCTNENSPDTLLKRQYPLIAPQYFLAFNHVALSRDSIIFMTYSHDSLFLFLYSNNLLKPIDSLKVNIGEPLVMKPYYYFSNIGDKYVVYFENELSKNTYLLEGSIENLKFKSLNLRFKNLLLPTTTKKIKLYEKITFNFNDSFYYLIPFDCITQNSQCYKQVIKVHFGDTQSTLKNNFALGGNEGVLFSRLTYDNCYYIFTENPKNFVRLYRIKDDKLTLLMERHYDTFSNVSHILYPPVNFITEPYLFLDYSLKVDCKQVTVYNKSNPRFKNHRIYIQALNDTFDFTDSISFYIPKKFTKSYYKIIGYANTGAVKWMEDTLQIPMLSGNFSPSNDTICQFNNITFNDLSTSDTVNGNGYNYLWDFGDGSTIVINNTKNKITSISHQFLKSGAFIVKLIFSNGFCTDTFEYPSPIIVLAAVKPGFSLNSHLGCIPFQLNIKDTIKGNVLKSYDFGNGFIQLQNKELDTSLVFSNEGTFHIRQRIINSTGCQTEFEDSVSVFPGVNSNDTVQVYFTTVLNKNITQTVWKRMPHATKYLINNITTTDTFYIDQNSSPELHSEKYFIKAMDTCGNQSVTSPISETIYLKAENHNFNEYGILQYTSYEKWKEGVLEYQIEYYDNTTLSWKKINVKNSNILTSNEPILPDSFNQQTGLEICYRVIAKEQNGNNQQSTSNVACIPVYPVVFLPNAFSPNGDGINDFFKPICSGLSIYQFEIYDRWGQLLYTDSPESRGWDGTFRGIPLGSDIYIYRLSATGHLASSFTNNARQITKGGTILLVR